MGAALSSRSWLLLLAVGLCGCIVSVAGLTGGSADAGPPDATTDGSSDGPADTGPTPDGASDGGNCVPYSPPDATVATTCPPPSNDAGPDGSEGGPACSAASLPMFQPSWVPPNPTQNVCTPAQIDMVVTCLSTNSSSCASFVQQDAGNQRCIQCMVSAAGDQSYGAVVQQDNLDVLNVGGCIALVDPCQAACGQASLAVDQCHFAACGSCLAGSGNLQAFIACTNVADTCSCAPQAVADQACGKRLQQSSAAANCYPSKGFTPGAQYIGKVFCGGGP
jgi:hypothetical protein